MTTRNGITLGANSSLLTRARARQLLTPTEADDQKALIELLLGRFWDGGGDRRAGLGMTAKHPELLLLYAINPNKGGQSSKAARGIAKAMGLLPDMPDLHLPVMRGPFIGLYLELKRAGRYANASQRERHDALRAEGHCVVECQGVEESAAAILGYLSLPENRPSVRPIAGPGASGPIADRLRQWRAAASVLLTPRRGHR